MVSFLSFVTLVLASMVAASPLELKMESNLGKRDYTVTCSDSTQADFIFDSYNELYNIAEIAYEYIDENGASDPVFITYFGADRDSTMQSDVFDDLVRELSLTFSCNDPSTVCPASCVATYSAFDGSPNIYFCPRFFSQVPIPSLCSGTSVDSNTIRSGTMLSIVSTKVSMTNQSSSGCSNARSLALSEPDCASTNADNYSCFAMQVYANVQCPQKP